MKAISLILCFLLPQAIVGSIYNSRSPQDNRMVNQRPLDFIDQYPNEINNEETVKTSTSVEDVKSENLSSSSSKENSQINNIQSSEETIQEKRNSVTQDNEIQNQEQQKSVQSKTFQISESEKTESPDMKPATSSSDSYETQKQSSEELPNSESRSAESQNSESKRDKSQKSRSKANDSTMQYAQTEVYKSLRPTSRSEDQPKQDERKQSYKSQKSENKKYERQMAQSAEAYQTNSKSFNRQQLEDRSSNEQPLNFQPRQAQYISNFEKQLQEYRNTEPKQYHYQAFDAQNPEEQSFKGSDSKKSKNQSKKSKYSKKFNQKQIKTKPEKRDEYQSEVPLYVQRDVSENYKPYNNEDKRQPMLRYKSSEEESRSEYPLPSYVYVNRQYPVNEREYFMNWMQRYAKKNAMKLIASKTEEWKHFYIPATNTESSVVQDNQARYIDIMFDALKEQETIKGNRVNATELVKEVFSEHAEEHTVKTEDGYILTMFRIVPSTPTDSKRPPVLLMHGLLGSADDWLIARESSLAHLLVKAGHEVWLGNVRGSKYSRRHVAKHSAQPDFWQFSNDEVALFDLPAMIDYALNVSKHEKMVYVGYSQASADFFALASTRPEYNDKIIAMYALAPMVYMTSTRSPLVKMMAPSSEYFTILQDQQKEGQFHLNKAWQRMAGAEMCENIIGSKKLCSNMRFIMSGVNMVQIDADMAADILRSSEAGASVRQMKQVGQAVESQEFRMYDHGAYMNSIVYGSAQAPRHELGRVTVPVALYYGAEDWLASGADARRLQRALPRAAAHALPGFTSMDMLFGSMAPRMLYQQLVASMPKDIRTN